MSRAQLGWQQADLLYPLCAGCRAHWKIRDRVLPDHRAHRPGIDTGGAFTWTDKPTKLQFNGTAGFTFNFENTATDYDSGNEFHFEWAIGREICPGLVVGVVVTTIAN